MSLKLSVNLAQALTLVSIMCVGTLMDLPDGLDYALKKVRIDILSDKERTNAINEVRILASVKDPNVVSYKDVFVE